MARKQIDWEGIEREYRAGQCSVSEIARSYECSEGAIRKRAKRGKWTRDLTKQVQQGVKSELLGTSQVRGSNAGDAQIVEQAAKIGADVVRSHRKAISSSHEMCELLMGELKATSLSLNEIEAWIHVECLGEDGKIDLDKQRRMMSAISLPSRTASMRNLVQSLSHLVRLERQAFNLDEHGGESSHEDSLKDLA